MSCINNHYSDYVAAWCGFTAEFIHGPFSLKFSLKGPKRCCNTSACTVNSFNSRSFLLYRNDSVFKPLHLYKMEQLAHIGRQVKALLLVLTLVVIGFSGNWPSHSPDLNSWDFWLCGFLKDHVYKGGIRTSPDLKASIIRHVAEWPRELFRATIENTTYNTLSTRY
ncbi:uncharacterized protein TNCV_2584581 [Trichonephila clavipes]|nr:uncharacterized protein TNCV_2584581 [Trichonephila clavipes]